MGKPYHVLKYASGHDEDFTIIAHRGASAYFPENTLPAFEAAMNMGADMVELDVQLTSDKEVVVFHDEKLSRCTDGGGRVFDWSLAGLKKLDAGSWFDKKFKNTRIPTLAEVLDLCKNKIAVNIEIKSEAIHQMFFGGIEEKCLKIVDLKGMKKHVIFSSFDPRAIMHVKEIDRRISAAVLFEKKYYGSKLPSEIMSLVAADAFNCSRGELNQKWMADITAHRIPVHVYTINDAKTMRRLMEWGVDGIFTNKPDVLKKAFSDWNSRNKRNENTK